MPTKPTAGETALTLTTPLKDELVISSFHGNESLGRLFQFDLELSSLNEAIDIDKILGQAVTVHFNTGDGEVRNFNGIVSSFSQSGQMQDGGASYQATLRPWLWFLTRTADCRLFHKLSVPDIIKQIFRDQGFSNILDKLNEEHKPWDYCVQYRETDFNFISRLMEEEGIYYYFIHEDGKHSIVLADSSDAHRPIRDNAVKYYPIASTNLKSEACISSWFIRREVQSGAYALNDYDFRRPKASLRVREQIQKKNTGSEYEIYDCPGEYADRFEESKGEYADLRIQELHVQEDQINAVTDVRLMSNGGLFKLENHPRKDQNKEYLVIDAAYEISLSGGSGGTDMVYQCQFTAIDGQIPFRPARVTSKPVVQGPQTAVVVDDVADEYGRVKVRFYWDRDEEDSCWVRVSQDSAGSGWGSMFVPHIGHEVIVSFLEGDPDRPIITGRVYNADNMPPDLWSGGIDNSVITDHVENKINLDGAGTPIIHITQPSGNEILMNDEEGIQIRDRFGNEIVTDAVAGTMKIRSPSHESVIELGKSIFIGSSSNLKEQFKGDQWTTIEGKVNTVVFGTKDEYIVGPVKFKYDGINSKFHGGLVHDLFLGAKRSDFYGLKFGISRGVNFSQNKDYRRMKDKKVERNADISITEKAPKIEYAAEKSKIMLNAKRALFMSGKSQVMVKKSGNISANGNADIVLSAKNNTELKAGTSVTLDAPVLVLAGTKIEIG
ncbi:MAG: type VI secretion system tip protein TssI/VgrG [Gammaproteobacteria bacterium]